MILTLKNLMKLKYKIIIIVLITLSMIFYIRYKNNNVLDFEYYGNGTFIEIDSKEFDKLKKTKNILLVFVNAPLCSSSDTFNDVLLEFMETNNISLYKMSSNEIKKNDINNQIKYYPTFLILRNGKLVSYLKANKTSDMKYYQSSLEFKEWINNYVKIKKNY